MVRLETHRNKFQTEPALSFVPEPLAPPKGCWPTTAPVGLKNTSGFLPVERAWIHAFIERGFIDTFRYFNNKPHNYSWWSYRANARNNNKGWRIDYLMASTPLKARLKRAYILPEAKHSDHCPIVLEIEG